MTVLRLSQRSTSTPAGKARSKVGKVLAKPITPRSNGRPEMRYARYGWAVFCIQVPITDMNCPTKNKTKSREASAGKRWPRTK